MDMRPFNPSYGSGQVVAAGAAAAAVTNLLKGDQNVVISNQGSTNGAYVRIADAGDASAADYYIPPSGQLCLTKAPGQTRLSHISASGTNLHIITGNGW